jgi:hypothetical protein
VWQCWMREIILLPIGLMRGQVVRLGMMYAWLQHFQFCSPVCSVALGFELTRQRPSGCS